VGHYFPYIAAVDERVELDLCVPQYVLSDFLPNEGFVLLNHVLGETRRLLV
jgi:hypothetical protein